MGTIFLSLPFSLQTQFIAIVVLQLTVSAHCFDQNQGNCTGRHKNGAFLAAGRENLGLYRVDYPYSSTVFFKTSSAFYERRRMVVAPAKLCGLNGQHSARFFQVHVPTECVAQYMRRVAANGARAAEVVVQRFAVGGVDAIIDDHPSPLTRR